MTHWCWAKLNDLWKACQRSSILRYEWCLIVSIAESFLILIQFISSQGSFFLFKISCILASKNSYLVFLTAFLKFFQSSKYLDSLYISKYLWQFSFHHTFECLVILASFECLHQLTFILFVKSCIICSRSFLLLMWLVLSLLINLMTSAIKLTSSLLFLMIVHFLVWMFSSKIETFTIKGVWSNNNFQLE